MIEKWPSTKTKRKRTSRSAAKPTVAQQAKARRYATKLCKEAATVPTLELANRLAIRWTGCDCDELTKAEDKTI